jgi:hypothetical protein
MSDEKGLKDFAMFRELKEGVDYSKVINIYGEINELGAYNIVGDEDQIKTPANKIEELYIFAKESVENIDLVLSKEPKKELHDGIKVMITSAYATAILAKDFVDGKRKKVAQREWGETMLSLIEKIKYQYPKLN